MSTFKNIVQCCTIFNCHKNQLISVPFKTAVNHHLHNKEKRNGNSGIQVICIGWIK